VKAGSATCPKVLLLPFSFWTKPIPSMIETHGVGISSAAGTFFSSSLARAALFVTFHVRRRRHEMYSGPARLCVCLSVCLSLTTYPYYYTDPDVTWGMVGGALLQHGLNFTTAWWTMQLISGEKDWKHVSVQKVVTLNTCCDVVCLTLQLPHITTGSSQNHQCLEEQHYLQSHQKSFAFYKVVR